MIASSVAFVLFMFSAKRLLLHMYNPADFSAQECLLYSNYSTVWLHFKWALSETDRKSPNALYVAIGCVVEDQQQALPPQAPRA